jgi:hypothetical protein
MAAEASAGPARRSRKKAAEAVSAAAPADAGPARRSRKPAVAADAGSGNGAAAPRRRSRRKPGDPAEPLATPVAQPIVADEVAPPAPSRRKAATGGAKPAARRKPAAKKPAAAKRTRAKKTTEDAPKSALEAASERVRAAVEDAAA